MTNFVLTKDGWISERWIISFDHNVVGHLIVTWFDGRAPKTSKAASDEIPSWAKLGDDE